MKLVNAATFWAPPIAAMYLSMIDSAVGCPGACVIGSPGSSGGGVPYSCIDARHHVGIRDAAMTGVARHDLAPAEVVLVDRLHHRDHAARACA